MELVKSVIEHREPISVGFFILHNAKLRMLDLKLYHLKLYLHSKQVECTGKRSKNCQDNFRADAKNNFFSRTCCSKNKKHDKREPGSFKEEFKCTDMLCLCSKTYCCYISKSQKYKFRSKGLNKRALEDSGDGPMAKYRQVLDEAVNSKSTYRGFKTVNHTVATYEQTKKRTELF